MIRAEVHSDDYKHAAKFDATPWFEQASAEDVVRLAKCEWGGDYPADEVAEFFETKPGYEDVTELFDYVHADPHPKMGDGDQVGFECHVHQSDAYAWLAENRPDVFKAAAEAAGEDPETLLDGQSFGPGWDDDVSWSGDYNAAPAAPQP